MEWDFFFLIAHFLIIAYLYLFIYELLDNIRSSDHLFANDGVLYRNINSLTDCQILQDELNSLANESLIGK